MKTPNKQSDQPIYLLDSVTVSGKAFIISVVHVLPYLFIFYFGLVLSPFILITYTGGNTLETTAFTQIF